MNAPSSANVPASATAARAGRPLDQLLEAGPLGLDVALGAAVQLALQLDELHARGRVHHGLRPSAVSCDPDAREAWIDDWDDVAPPTDAAVLRGARAPASRLAWQAPEQTGRLPAGTDARTDLYALGLLLYAMLVGAPAAPRGDALTLIHWQLAGMPRPPAAVAASVPPIVSDLVMKLLAKAPADRYQSARGVVADLRACERAWRENGSVPPFVLGRHDGVARIAVPDRLYGREADAARLDEAFDAGLRAGRPTLVLVEGGAGTGKTSLVLSRAAALLQRRGRLAGGKFDQLARSVPLSAIVAALRGLVRQLLAEPEAELAGWRVRLNQALEPNAGVLCALVPELAFVIGEQPAPEPATGGEAQNRLQRVLQRFVGAVAGEDRPLLLFLDDLQWADAASLQLLQPMLGSPLRGLLLVGALRDDEREAAPALEQALREIRAAGVPVRQVRLAPLGLAPLTELVADTLKSPALEAAPLARRLLEATGGNPLFAVQFLQGLARDGRLHWDPSRGHWSCDVAQLGPATVADDVVALLTRRIAHLAPGAQRVLTLAACIGASFELHTLATVCEQDEASTAADLRPALAEGLILPATPTLGHGVGPAYAFLHDRVQQSAYALIPVERRRQVHLSIGRLLAGDGDAPTARLFDAAYHLNRGRELMHDRDERWRLARLDLDAGRRAKASAAHAAALELFEAGLLALPDDVARDDPALAFDLRIERAEGLQLCRRLDEALEALDALSADAPDAMALARLAQLRSLVHEAAGRYAQALASGLDGLAALGMQFAPDEPAQLAALERELAAIDALRGGRDIAALEALPRTDDPRVRQVMAMLTDHWASAFIVGRATLARLFSATMVRLSLEHGDCEASAYGYVTHAITVGPLRGDYRAADDYGCLALAVNRKYADRRLRAKVHQQFHAHVAPWCRPYAECVLHARAACSAGLDSGDFLYAAYGAGTEAWPAMAAAPDLAAYVDALSPRVSLLEQLGNAGFADAVRVQLAWALALQGRTEHPLSLRHAGLDEASVWGRWTDHPFFSAIHAVVKLQLACLFDTPARAFAAARVAAPRVAQLPGTVWGPVFDFWHSHAIGLALADDAGATPGDALAPLSAARQRLAALADCCAANFETHATLLGSALASAQGRRDAAWALAEEAVEAAARHAAPDQQGLAHEHAARLAERIGRPALARMHLRQARDAFRRWGASAKVAALEARHAFLRVDVDAGAHASTPASTSTPPAADDGRIAAPSREAELDLFSVLRATEAIAVETEPGALLAQLLRIASVSAGAERATLVLQGDAGPRVIDEAHGWQRGVALPDQGIALDAAAELPAGRIRYVLRTGQPLSSDDDDLPPDARDAAATRGERSWLCVPVQARGRVPAALLLENRQVHGAFAAERRRIVQALAVQAAIALDNALLLEGLRAALDEVRQLKDELEAENSLLRRDLVANVSHDLRTPLMALRGYLEMLSLKGPSLPAEERASYVDIALRQSDSLARLIDELFELAKLEIKGMQLQREVFSVAELAHDVTQKFRLAADAKQVRLRVEAGRALPLVDADLGLVERVFDNLVGNALRHTPADGCVTLSLQPTDGGVRIEVADTGCGIEPEALPHVFERHWRGRERAGGAGLGLAISQRILALHGCALGVTSAPGAGSCFSFVLPLPQAASAHAAA